MQNQNNQKISIIIPTMQKDLDVLNKLIAELAEDNSIGEILIIDNSLKGYSYPSEKVKVHIPEKNLFVNPSWNYGIENASFNILGILNDDLLLPQNLCKEILNFILNKPKCGLIGLESSNVIQADNQNFSDYPMKTVPKFKRIKNIWEQKNYFWGSAIFGKKENFYLIPEEIKIHCGDNFLMYKNNCNKKQNFAINNITVKHYGSLTSSSPEFKTIKENDQFLYAQIDQNYKKMRFEKSSRFKTVLQMIFSVTNSSNKKHKIITFLGLKLKLRRKKNA